MSIRPRRTARTSRRGMSTVPWGVWTLTSSGGVAFHWDLRWRVLLRDILRLGTAMVFCLSSADGGLSPAQDWWGLVAFDALWSG